MRATVRQRPQRHVSNGSRPPLRTVLASLRTSRRRRMEFRLLGPVEAVRDHRPLPLGGAKPRALLAFLVLHANEVVSRDRLIEALWPERAPDELLLTRSGGYVLEVEPEAVDASRFERLLEVGRRSNVAGKPQDALRALEAALALWRGDALG